MKKYILLSFLAFTLLPGCQKENHCIPDNKSYNMPFGNTAESCKGDYHLRVVSIEDSRCPTGVECFLEGNAEVRIVLEKKGLENPFVLNSNSKFKSDTTISGLEISLEKVQPYPKKFESYKQEDYSVEIIVREI